jgi:hypothetical protein
MKETNQRSILTLRRKLIEAGLTPGTEPFQKRMLEHINAVTKGARKRHWQCNHWRHFN